MKNALKKKYLNGILKTPADQQIALKGTGESAPIKTAKKPCFANKALHGIVVHPYTPGTTGIANILGKEETLSAVKKWGLLEMYNGTFESLIAILKATKLNYIFRKKFRDAINTRETPKDLPFKNIIQTGGSDAHHPWEIGWHMAINKEYKDNYDYLFKTATSNSGKIVMNSKIFILGLPINAVTVLREWLMKTTIKLLK